MVAAKEALTTGGILEPAELAAAIKKIEAKLRHLDKLLAAADTEMRDPLKIFNAPKIEVDEAEAHFERLVDKGLEIAERITALQQDLAAVGCAMTRAQQELQKAKAAYAAAQASLFAADPHAEAMPGVAAARDANLGSPILQ